ncbi:MAG: DUF1992 domain-containing protein [Planctomycetaceae bacterium]
MTERKPALEKWESFAERKIREAMDEGEFDALPGFGQPIPDIDKPLSDDWWLKQKLKRERLSVLPPILEARLDIERTLESLHGILSEYVARRTLEQLNERIRKAHFSPQEGPSAGVFPIDIDATIAMWRKSRTEEPKSI